MIMLNFFRNLLLAHLEPMKQMWLDAETPGQKAVALVVIPWISALMILFWIGWTFMVYKLITEPEAWQNASFGIFDYCC